LNPFLASCNTVERLLSLIKDNLSEDCQLWAAKCLHTLTFQNEFVQSQVSEARGFKLLVELLMTSLGNCNHSLAYPLVRTLANCITNKNLKRDVQRCLGMDRVIGILKNLVKDMSPEKPSQSSQEILTDVVLTLVLVCFKNEKKAALLPEHVPSLLVPFLTSPSIALPLGILEIFVILCSIPLWHQVLKRKIGTMLFDIRSKIENQTVHSKVTYVLKQLYLVRRKRVGPDNRRIIKNKWHQHGRGWWARMAFPPQKLKAIAFPDNVLDPFHDC